MVAKSAQLTAGQRDTLEPVSRHLHSLSELTEDWDSYGGDPPSDTALEMALALCRRVSDELSSVVGERALPLDISPLANGGVEMEWRGGGCLIAVDVGPDGSRGYMTKTGTGQEARYEEGDDVSEETLLSLVREVLLAKR